MSDPRVSPLLARLGGLYRDPGRVERDASQLLRHPVGQHLRPEIKQVTDQSHRTLCLNGTIAIHYKGQTYQQLVDVAFPEGYPVRPPDVFVRTAPNMYIKENHAHVDTTGRVYLPYLHEWRSNSHDMIELIVAMSSVFSADPPVFARPKNSRGSSRNSSSNNNRNSSGNNNNGSSSSSHQPPPPSYDASMREALRQSQKEAEERTRREAEEANRIAELARKAEQDERKRKEEAERQRIEQEQWDAKVFGDKKTKVKQKLAKHLTDLSRETKASVGNDWKDQASLKSSGDRLKEQMKFMKAKKQELQQAIDDVDQATSDVKEWLEEHESQANSQEEIDLDEAVSAQNRLHQQMLDLSAENHALTDALYFLDKALHRGSLTISEHLKECRRLAKRQFLVRAHLIKIAQMQAYKN